MLKNLKLLLVACSLASAATGVSAQMATAGYDFLQAVKKREGDKVLELIRADGSTVLNFRDDKGEAALHVAAQRRDHEYLAFFLGRGANPNIQTNSGDTPLITAARIGDLDGINLLLASRAKVDLANRAGETPLIIAVQQRQAPVVKRLLEAGANPDRTDNASGRSARDYARLDRRNVELLRLIETVKPERAASAAGPKL